MNKIDEKKIYKEMLIKNENLFLIKAGNSLSIF